MRLRIGRDVRAVDVSNDGVLVDGTVRFLPGTHVEVHIITPGGRVLVRSRVARCCVSAVGADGVRYRAALAFDRPIDTRAVGYAVPPLLDVALHGSGPDYPVSTDAAAASTPDGAST